MLHDVEPCVTSLTGKSLLGVGRVMFESGSVTSVFFFLLFRFCLDMCDCGSCFHNDVATAFRSVN